MHTPVDGGGPTEVGAALARTDECLVDAVESALAERDGVVAVGVPLALLPPILAARERSTGEPWRIACRSGVVDTLGRALVLGTAVAEAVETDGIVLRSTAGTDRGTGGEGWTSDRSLFATPGRVDAVVGPPGDRALVTGSERTGGGGASEADADREATHVAGAVRVVRERFEAATPATVDMPSRSRLLAAAAEHLDDRFAADVAAVLESLEYGEVGRLGRINDQTLLLALAARHDHLFNDLRRWIGTGEPDAAVGRRNEDGGTEIAPGQELTAERRALVERELIESIKVPMGDGRPNLRLRAVDDALLRARPSEVLSVLRGRFAIPLDDGTLRRGPDRRDRRPVWQRDR